MLKLKIKAFTLLECLVALLAISGSLLVIEGLNKIVSADLISVSRQSEGDWQLFCSMLRQELAGSEFQKVENNYLYVKKKDDWRFGQIKNSRDFRKTHKDGRGHQPMIYGVKDSQIDQEGSIVLIRLTMESGEKYSFSYDINNYRNVGNL